MSNAIKRMKTKIDKKNNEVYSTLIGSIVTTFGIINGICEDTIKSVYKGLKKNKNKLPNTVDELCKVVWGKIGKDENIPLRANAVLVYDKLNIRTPLVTLVDNDGNLLPLKRDGEYTGILLTAAAGSNLVNAEFLYEEDGTEIKEEEENK